MKIKKVKSIKSSKKTKRSSQKIKIGSDKEIAIRLTNKSRGV